MKLRIQGDNLRLRITPSEMFQLVQNGRVAETIHFAPDAQLTYALEQSPHHQGISVAYGSGRLVVKLEQRAAEAWAAGSEVGIYGRTSAGEVALAIAIEKDFACLDKSEEENRDRYPNPNLGAVC